MPTRVLIADDHDIVRTGLRIVLEENRNFLVVAEAGTGAEAIDQARRYAPDLVIMDVSMPGTGGIEATAALLREQPKCRVLGLSMHESQECLVRMLKAGASGYVLKIFAAKEIVAAAEAVVQGRTYLSPTMIGGMVKDLLTGGEPQPASAQGLSPRQLEVVKHILGGKSLKEIAFCLNLSVKTLEKHRLQAMARLGANSSAELAVIAIRMGLVDPWDLA